MATNNESDILFASLDCLAWADYMFSESERTELINSLILELKDYPVNRNIMHKEYFFAFFYVLCCRLTLLSFKCGFIPFSISVRNSKRYIEKALGILLD